MPFVLIRRRSNDEWRAAAVSQPGEVPFFPADTPDLSAGSREEEERIEPLLALHAHRGTAMDEKEKIMPLMVYNNRARNLVIVMSGVVPSEMQILDQGYFTYSLTSNDYG